MRFHNQLDDLFGNQFRLRLLRILVRTEARGLTGRELARIVDASPSQINVALQELEETGLIRRDVVGRAHTWRMAEGHTLVPALVTLFRQEAESLVALKGDIQNLVKKLPVRRAILFGSVARGDERPASDVDLLAIVRSRADKEVVEEALSKASIHFAIKFGNPLSTLVLEERQLSTSANPAFLANVLRDGVELETGA
jgi:predicted nucleotidyltransferase/DNA-binding HxlR family transcriptional regulator